MSKWRVSTRNSVLFQPISTFKQIYYESYDIVNMELFFVFKVDLIQIDRILYVEIEYLKPYNIGGNDTASLI